MDKQLKRIIKDICSEAELDSDKTDELEKELQSHFFEKFKSEKDSNLNKLNTEKIMNDFGDHKKIGRELYKVNHILAEVPVLGALLYYRPTRIAMKLFFWLMVVYIAELVVYIGLDGVRYSFLRLYELDAFVDFIILLIPLLFGVFFASRVLRGLELKEAVQTVFLAQLPIILFLVITHYLKINPYGIGSYYYSEVTQMLLLYAKFFFILCQSLLIIGSYALNSKLKNS